MQGDFFYKEHFRHVANLKIREAQESLLTAVKLDYGPAKCRLGYYYNNGYLRFELSKSKAVKLWDDAYRNNKNPLALMYLAERVKETCHWDKLDRCQQDIERAISSGHPIIMARYGKNVEENVKKAISLGMVETYDFFNSIDLSFYEEGVKQGAITNYEKLYQYATNTKDKYYYLECHVRLTGKFPLIRETLSTEIIVSCSGLFSIKKLENGLFESKRLYLLYPETQRCREAIVTFILCCRNGRYLLKEMVRIIVKKIWETREDPLWTLICPVIIEPKGITLNKEIW